MIVVLSERLRFKYCCQLLLEERMSEELGDFLRAGHGQSVSFGLWPVSLP